MDFVDTSVLYAALTPGHIFHGRAITVYLAATAQSHSIAAHSLAELYAKLTSVPPKVLSPVAAKRAVFQTSERFLPFSLSSQEVLDAISGAASLGIAGGTIYDALLIASARKIRAARIVTFNTKHFRRVAPDLADIIFEP